MLTLASNVIGLSKMEVSI